MYEKQTFGARLPTLHEFIPAPAQFGGRQRLVENKRIRYFHKDKLTRKALEDASWELNPVGTKTFYDTIMFFEKRAKFITLEENGQIKEKYESGEKSYQTNGKTCTCSSYGQNLFCRHIIFYRQEFSLPMFDAEDMHHALLKQSARTDIKKNNPDLDISLSDDLSPPSPGLEMAIEEERRQRKGPTQAKRYNQGYDCGKEMAEVLAVYDSCNFDTYLLASQNFVKLLRSGLSDELVNYLKDPENFAISSLLETPDICTESSTENTPTPPTGADIQPQPITNNKERQYPSSGSEHMTGQPDEPSQPSYDENLSPLAPSYETRGVPLLSSYETGNSPFPSHHRTRNSPLPSGHRMGDPEPPSTSADYRRSTSLPAGFREIPDLHKQQFSPDSIIKSIKPTGGCGYGGISYKIYHDEDLYLTFREPCHEFLIRTFDIIDAGTFLWFPMEVIVKKDEGFGPDYLYDIEDYKAFLRKRKSLTSFIESNLEIQNISNMLNIDIHVFSFGGPSCYWSTYTPDPRVVGFSEWAFPTNEKINTVVLYHSKGSHYDVIVPRTDATNHHMENEVCARRQQDTHGGQSCHGEWQSDQRQNYQDLPMFNEPSYSSQVDTRQDEARFSAQVEPRFSSQQQDTHGG